MKKDLKIALVHDFLLYPGGAEKVLRSLSSMFPEAPIYTLLYDKRKMRGMFAGKDIRTSYLQYLPGFIRRRYRWLAPFFPVMVEVFNLREFDLVISSSGAWSKGIVTRLNTKHIAYIHSPTRFIWDYHSRYFSESREKPGFFTRLWMSYLRLWDYDAAQRPDYLIANSVYTQARIEKYYRRQSMVIYPPVGIFEKKASVTGESKDENFFLIVSRLSPYKKVDVAVEAFNKLGLPLVVIGEGRQEKYLRRIAGPNVKILGWQSDKKVDWYYRRARAFVFPSDDDFGIAAVEALNYGIPVIAFGHGGVREIVREGINGEFFQAQTVEVLADGVRKFMENEARYDKKTVEKSATRFTENIFREKIERFLMEALTEKEAET